MLAGIADDLRWRIEAHRLGIEEGGAEDVGMTAFEPGRGIGDQGERRRMAFRKTVGAEATQLLEGLLGALRAIAIGDHAAHPSRISVTSSATQRLRRKASSIVTRSSRLTMRRR